jgi:membrane protein DedA with SNARE-associated domain
MEHVPGLIDQYPLMGLVLLLVLGAAGLPFPEDLTLLLCGFLIANDVLRPWPALVFIYAVLAGVDFLFFSLGRKYGPGIINRRPFRHILSRERTALLEEKFRKWGLLLVILGRHIVVLRTQLTIGAGIFRMPPFKFLVADLITVPVTMAIMIGLGYAGATSLQIVRKDVTRVEHWVLLAAVSAMVVYLMFQTWKSRRS